MRPRKKDRHLPPCVYRRHGAYYLVKRGKWTRLGKTLPAALAEYATRHEQPRGGMADLIDRAFAHLRKANDWSPNTVSQYTVASRKLKDILAEFAPDQVLPRHVAQIKVAMVETPNMANRCLSFLRSVFAIALEWGEVDTNPVVGIKRYDEQSRERLLEPEEFARVRQYAAPRLQLMIDLMFLTGQRVMDVVQVGMADIRETGIYVRQQKTKVKRLVEWTPELREAVEEAKRLQGAVRSLWLFTSRNRRPPAYRTVYDQWRAACEAAGVADAQMRDLRAFSLTEAEGQGLDPTALAGHASRAMTERYLRAKRTLLVQGPTIAGLRRAENG